MRQQEKINFLEKYLGKSYYRPTKNQAQFFCIFCDHYKKKLDINLETNAWHCWKCGEKGFGYAKIFSKLNNKEAYRTYLEKFKEDKNKLKFFEQHQKENPKLQFQ